jgi:hypothetical protein
MDGYVDGWIDEWTIVFTKWLMIDGWMMLSRYLALG